MRPSATGPVCASPGCRRAPTSYSRYCNPCRHQLEKAKDPERVAYRHLKSNVNTRNKRRAQQGRPPIRFVLTLEEFREFSIKHEYILKAGRSGFSYHVDRMCDCDDGPGYCRENIQVLENRDNVLKELAKRRRAVRCYEYQSKTAYWSRTGWPEAQQLSLPYAEVLPF